MSTRESRREALQKITLADIEKQAVHAGLWLDTYLPEQEYRSEENQARTEETEKKQQNGRTQHIDEVCNLEIPGIYHQYFQRWKEALNCYGAKTRTAEVTSRMSVGLGQESVLETSVTLHHTYGVPYIAGSALKGLAASYMRQHLLPEHTQDKKDTESKSGDSQHPWKRAYNVIFGNQDNAGYIIFFDALYIPKRGERPLLPDVITVHHQTYYQGANEAPADWDSPVPVPFPSAHKRYLIALAAPDLVQADQWIRITFDILEEALKTMGIGAKTSSGYGRMRYVSPFSSEAQEIIKEIGTMPYVEINQKIQKSYERWRKLTDQADRLGVAQAIIEKVRTNNYEPRKIKLDWYRELLAFVEQTNKGEKE